MYSKLSMLVYISIGLSISNKLQRKWKIEPYYEKNKVGFEGFLCANSIFIFKNKKDTV